MDERTYKILKTIYDNDGKLLISDRRSPFNNGTPEKSESYHYLLDKKFIEYNQCTCIIHITIAGSSYVENVKQKKRQKYINVLNVSIALIALIKSFLPDIKELFK